MNDATNEAASADATKRGGHGAALSMAAVLGVALVALLVFPGFIAAGFSRTGPYVMVVDDNAWDVGMIPLHSVCAYRTEQALLAPSVWLMKHSQAIHRFYMWQYRATGGMEFNVYD